MHPYISELMAGERARELRAQAQQARLHVQRPGPRNSLRHRAGWTLIEVGLRVAGTSRDN
jgi:hypothetical protein